VPVVGRPLEIARILDPASGRTVGDVVVNTIRTLGAGPEAAAAAGMRRATYYDALRDGKRAALKQARGETLNRRERVLARFSDQVTQAIDEWHLRQLAGLADAERGGWVDEDGEIRGPQLVTITEKVLQSKDGETLIERVTKRQPMPGEWRIRTWRLERAFPSLYHPRTIVEVHGDGDEQGQHVEDAPGAGVLAALEAMVERKRASTAALQAAAIEVTGTETN
jgi:hypothetical protein